MYTGTLIRDLMVAVERAERQGAQQRLIAEEQELERLFELQNPAQGERVLVGAA